MADLRQGGGAVGISEYTSRECRLRLVEAAKAGLERELEDKCAKGVSQFDRRTGAARLLAGELGVSVRTVQRWLNGGVQSCNINAEKLIVTALKYAPEETGKLLEQDLETHRFWYERILDQTPTGGWRTQSSEEGEREALL